MKRMLVLTLAMVMALAFFVKSAHAATTSGVVVSNDVTPNVVTIQTADGRNLSFAKDEDTTVTRSDGTTLEPTDVATWFADLEPGTTITVTSKMTPSTSDTDPSGPSVLPLATNVEIGKVAAVSSGPRVVARNDEPAEAPMSDDPADTATDDPAYAMADRLPSTATSLPFILFAATGLLVAGLGLRGRELRVRRR